MADAVPRASDTYVHAAACTALAVCRALPLRRSLEKAPIPPLPTRAAAGGDRARHRRYGHVSSLQGAASSRRCAGSSVGSLENFFGAQSFHCCNQSNLVEILHSNFVASFECSISDFKIPSRL